MPLLEVEIVGDTDADLPAGLARQLADAAGRIFESGPNDTWVRLRRLEPDRFAENGGAPEGVQPVFVQVLKYTIDPDKNDAQIARLTGEFGRICGRPPENVHVLLLPAAKGRMYFGGVPAS